MEKKMWNAYAKQAGGVTFDGKPLPDWDGLGADRQACWVAAAKVAENKLEIREGQFRGALGELIRTRQQNVELVEALEIAADGFRDCGAEDLEDMCRAVIAKATGEK